VGAIAKFNLSSNASRINLRPTPQTSADAASLPMLPGFVRYNEITGGVIQHALSFTSFRIRHNSNTDFVWPARHTETQVPYLSAPPMGSRFRLKERFTVEGFPTPLTVPEFIRQVCVPRDQTRGNTGDCEQVRVILVALQQYGMILHDGGGITNTTLGLSGVHDLNWNDDLLVNILRMIDTSDFEVVDQERLRVQPPSRLDGNISLRTLVEQRTLAS
jgi:hypothetical protein